MPTKRASGELAAGEVILELKGVYKLYRTSDRHALSNVSLTLRRGEFVSIMGPSGSGKTTLLGLVAGYDDPSAGEVAVMGQAMHELGDRQRSLLRAHDLGVVTQSYNLLARLTVEENVLVRLGPVGIRGKEAQRRAAEALDAVALPRALWQRYPEEISGGEQQRVAFARALVAEPSLILADEPTGNLDTVTGTRLLDLLRRLNIERQTAVLMVTHDNYAATYGHRTVHMRDGAIESDISAAGVAL